jgi:S-adenosylmethionine uptake transporter
MPVNRSNLKGAACALGAFALYATHDVFIKTLGGTFAPFQIVFFSTLLSFPLVTLMMMRDQTRGTLIPVHPWWTALRTCCSVIIAGTAFYAFSNLPLAEVYAILFAAPMLITVLSIPILGERVGIHRWGAVIVGLVGVVIVLRPGASD